MKNLSQFKKTLTLGSEWTLSFEGGDDTTNRAPVKRTVQHIQSNAVAFSKGDASYHGNPYKECSWLYFESGEAKLWDFPNESTAVYYFKDLDTGERRTDTAHMVYRKA